MESVADARVFNATAIANHTASIAISACISLFVKSIQFQVFIVVCRIRYIYGDALKTGKKICVVCASKAFKDMIIEQVCVKLGEKFRSKILGYDSDTSDHDINKLGMIKKIWSSKKVKLVIYTTKITVGLSFDIPNVFNAIYIYGSVFCPIARDLMQSHFRVRHIIDKNIFIAINASNIHLGASKVNLAMVKAVTDSFNMCFKFKRDNLQSSFNEIYMSIIQYNMLEENIGHDAYSDVFMYFLKKIGYSINVIEQKKVARKESSEAYFEKGGYTVTREHDHESLDLFHPGYIKHYTTMCRNVIPIEDIKKRKCRSQATTIDKQTSDAYFFHNLISNKTTLCSTSEDTIREWLMVYDNKVLKDIESRAEILENTFVEQVECDLFNLYRSNRCFKQHVHNILIEMSIKKDNIQKYFTKATNVFQKQKDIMRLHFMSEFVKRLGLKNSFDTSIVLSDEKIKAIYDMYSRLDDTTKRQIDVLFGIRIRSDNKSIKQARSVLNQVFSCWNNLTFNIVEKKTIHGRDIYKFSLHQKCPFLTILMNCVNESRNNVDE